MRSMWAPAAFALFSCLGCMEQYKPWAFWNQLEQERLAAESHQLVTGVNGEIKTLAEDGTLVVETPDSGEGQPAGDSNDIASVYSIRCAACHGPDGGGNAALKARNFKDKTWQAEATDAQIVAVIKHGTTALLNGTEPEIFKAIQSRPGYSAEPYTGAMPANGAIPTPVLTDEQLDAMVQLIRGFAN